MNLPNFSSLPAPSGYIDLNDTTDGFPPDTTTAEGFPATLGDNQHDNGVVNQSAIESIQENQGAEVQDHEYALQVSQEFDEEDDELDQLDNGRGVDGSEQPEREIGEVYVDLDTDMVDAA